MLKVTAEAFHEKVNTGENEIVLNGPPSDLRGHIRLRNDSEDMLSVKTLSLVNNDEKQRGFLGNSPRLRIASRLRPGEEKLESVFHQLPSYTPPGTYESNLVIGGTERKVKMVVQPNIDITIHPTHFSFVGTEPGTIHKAEITLTNTGNVAFKIPDVKHVAALDMDLVCRAFGFALRSKGAEGYAATLDEITRIINRYLPEWASAHLEEQGQITEPGATVNIHLTLTLPKNTDGKKDYTGNMRFWNKEITYDIKSQSDQTKEDNHG